MFKKVYLDISGYCNAKCRWCVTYCNRSVKSQKGFMSADDFSRILERLTDIGAIDGSVLFALHNWGEPTLNQDFPGITKILAKNKFHWWYSTNASILPNLQESDFSTLISLLISMPGFSQASYDKIHGFKFENILSNIEKYLKFFNGTKPVQIAAHIYQFNMHEIPSWSAYAAQRKLGFMPYYAYLNNNTMARNYLNYKLPGKDLYDASTQLLLHYVRDLVQKQPRDYVCPQIPNLAMDEFGNVLQCCSIHRTEEYYSIIGSIFDLTLDEIIEKKKKSPSCVPCLNSGAVYWGHNPLFYQNQR